MSLLPGPVARPGLPQTPSAERLGSPRPLVVTPLRRLPPPAHEPHLAAMTEQVSRLNAALEGHYSIERELRERKMDSLAPMDRGPRSTFESA